MTVIQVGPSKEEMDRLCTAVEAVAVAANGIFDLLRRELSPAKPGIVLLALTGESGIMLHYKIILPPLDQNGDDDVVTRRLTVNELVQDIPPTQTEVAGFSGEQGTVVSGSLVDIDDAENQSAPRGFSFTLVDTLPPPQPGELGVVVTGEV